MDTFTNNTYDVIVIGAGHNGLTAAALLAKQGRKVLILERRSIIGGLAAGEEFHPGYHSGGLLHDTGQVHGCIIITGKFFLFKLGCQFTRKFLPGLVLCLEGNR